MVELTDLEWEKHKNKNDDINLDIEDTDYVECIMER